MLRGWPDLGSWASLGRPGPSTGGMRRRRGTQDISDGPFTQLMLPGRILGIPSSSSLRSSMVWVLGFNPSTTLTERRAQSATQIQSSVSHSNSTAICVSEADSDKVYGTLG